MSCSYSSVNADPANETLPSALSNLINDFYGNLTKTVVNGRVVWELPCDLSTGVDSIPREAGEGLGCYLLRIYSNFALMFDTVEGSPEGVVTAPVGAIRTRLDGGAGSTLYVKESGTGSTGWVAK